MVDFFISYNRNDEQWAEWIAWTLEDAGYTVTIQAWDFRAGENFALEMNNALAESKRVIAVLSEHFLQSRFTQPEWTGAFAADPTGAARKLIPVRVGACQPAGLLAAVIYIDLVGLNEADAKAALLDGLRERAKPSVSPDFPGPSASVTPSTPQPSFPGPAPAPTDPPPWTPVWILTAFVAALLVLAVWQDDKVCRLGFVAVILYVFVGIIAAYILFRMLNSSGLLKGSAFGTTLEFGGPAAVVILFLFAGLNARGCDDFAVSFELRDANKSDVHVAANGRLFFTLETRRIADVRDGYGSMTGIRADKRNDEVTIGATFDGGYALASPKIRLNPDAPIPVLVTTTTAVDPAETFNARADRLHDLLTRNALDVSDKEAAEMETLAKLLYDTHEQLGQNARWKDIYEELRTNRPHILDQFNIPDPETTP